MRFAADENFNGRILKALLSRLPNLEIVRVQDTEMCQANDPDLLKWLIKENRILLTHDVQIIETTGSIGNLVDDLEILVDAGTPEDFHNTIWYIPLS